MKSTGIVRAVDSLGRIVIPMELRKTLEITDLTSMKLLY
jgi:transcriptional pleiotropic regulator of transition state genes